MKTSQTIDNEIDHISRIREKLITAVKIQLHTGLAGFDSPESFGVYRSSGGKPLGTVGRVFEPANLSLFLDSVVHSVQECCSDTLDLTKLDYKEYKDGQKVSFEIPSQQFEVKSKLVGDVHQTKIQFFTGFDGLTKTSLTFSSLRLVCLNGAKNWKSDIALSFKNTIGNIGKIAYFGDQISKVLTEQVEYKNLLNTLASKQVSQSQVDTFLLKLLGYNQKSYKELTTRKRNILDKINQSVAIEERQLGMTPYTLLQGITRYTTHELAGGDKDLLMFDTPAKLNQEAHVHALALLN